MDYAATMPLNLRFVGCVIGPDITAARGEGDRRRVPDYGCFNPAR